YLLCNPIHNVVYFILSVFIISNLIFVLFQILPGDPTRVLLPRGGQSNATGGASLREELIHEWGLDQPVYVRFLVYMNNLLHGNLGTWIIYRSGTPVMTVITPRLTTTLLLIGG